MSTGRDVAAFAAKISGIDFLNMYDEGEKQEKEMKESVQNKFNTLIERMNKVDVNNRRDIID